LGVQVLILSLVFFLIGAEAAAPGVSRSVVVAAAETTVAVRDHTYGHLCARLSAHGRPCPASAAESKV